MARHFDPQHVKNGYAAMGAQAAPISGINGGRERNPSPKSIAAERRIKAARQAAASKKKK